MLLTSQLLVMVPRADAANRWPFDPAQATVAFYREMGDLHDEIINILYPIEREIGEADEMSPSEAPLPPVRLPVVPVNLPERPPVEQIAAPPKAAEAAPEPKRDSGSALHGRRTNLRSHHRASRQARRRHDYGYAGSGYYGRSRSTVHVGAGFRA
jgi:hypothetical protein